jgi:hypothetical protein
VLTETEHHCRRSITCTNYDEERVDQEFATRKLYKRSFEEPRNPEPMLEGVSAPAYFQPLFFLNEGIIPVQPLFYPVYSQQQTPFFSGRKSSFTNYSSSKSLESSSGNWPILSRGDS